MAAEPTLTDVLESVNNAFLIMQDSINERFDKIEIRFDKIEARIEKIEIRLDKMDIRLDKMDIRLGSMENKFGGLLGILTKNGVISKFEASHVSALPAVSSV